MTTDGQAIRTLKPSFRRTFFCMIWQLWSVIPLWAIFHRLHTGHWWNPDFAAQIVIAPVLLPPLVYFGFVPRRVEWTNTECRIRLKLDCTRILPWTQLCAYGDGNNVFYLKFHGVTRFQIFAGAFPRDDWKALLCFLKRNYPVRKTSWLSRAIWGNRVA